MLSKRDYFMILAKQKRHSPKTMPFEFLLLNFDLVPVVLRLKRPCNRYADVFGLVRVEFFQFHADLG